MGAGFVCHRLNPLGLGGRDTLLVVAPMFHANGWGLPFAAPTTGAKVVPPGRQIDGSEPRPTDAREGVSLAAGVQTVWLALADRLEAEGGKLPDLKRVVIGGSSGPDALVRRWKTGSARKSRRAGP